MRSQELDPGFQTNDHGDISAYDWPPYNPKEEGDDSASESSDFLHVGNGEPCQLYNHGGCARGGDCEFSHGPDMKGVRDML